MIRITILSLLALGSTALVTSDATAFLFSNNPPPLEHAAQPGFFDSCINCHLTSEINSGNGSLTISGLPGSYVPGVTYPITIEIEDPGQSEWGFEINARDLSGNGLGTWSNLPANTAVGTSGSNEYFSHDSGGTFDGTPDGPVSWTADWTAPAAGAGTVTFFAAGNAADSNGNPSGDQIYSDAVSALEAGASVQQGTVIPQLHKYSHQRVGSERLKAQIRVTNHNLTTTTFIVATRVKLPNGNTFPQNGFITTASLTIAPGETETYFFSKPIKDTSPIGTYEFEALIGFAPSTLIDSRSYEFDVN